MNGVKDSVRWQTITLVTLLVGYAGYYVCRSNLSVAAPLILKEYEGAGIDKDAMGLIASAGVLLYAIGKVFNGVICDFLGGRRMFLIGMAGSVVCTVLFGLSEGLALFVVIWSLNRLFQSTGWPALIKVCSRWFPMSYHGSLVGLISLSYLFGDAAARLFLGGIIELEIGWRQVFYAAAATLAAIALAAHFLLKDGPSAIGLKEPDANPQTVFGARSEAVRPESLGRLVVPLLSDGSFWLICGMSVGATLIRETFNFWTPTYLAERGASAGTAAMASTVFPLVGGISVLCSGFLVDKVGGGNRGVIVAPFLLAATVALFGLAQLGPSAGLVVPLVMIGVTSFLLIGPYSFLAGVLALDLGGRPGSSTASGWIDAAGYFGAMLSGWGVGALAQSHGWSAAFGALSAVGALTAMLAASYWYVRRRRDSPLEQIAGATNATSRK